jgi:hypothetical protein
VLQEATAPGLLTEEKMSVRAIVSVTSILGLLVTAATAQQPAVTGNAPAAAQPPLFQGIMVDAKGKTVGRLVINVYGTNFVVRQISGIWVELPVADVTTGFQITDNNNTVYYLYQSVDCAGQAYFSYSQVNKNNGRHMGWLPQSPRPLRLRFISPERRRAR